MNTITHTDEGGRPTTVRLLRHQRAAHIGGDLYVIRESALRHVGHYLDGLASEVLHAIDDKDAA